MKNIIDKVIDDYKNDPLFHKIYDMDMQFAKNYLCEKERMTRNNFTRNDVEKIIFKGTGLLPRPKVYVDIYLKNGEVLVDEEIDELDEWDETVEIGDRCDFLQYIFLDKKTVNILVRKKEVSSE